jgi:hypothetical protein
MGQQAKTIYAAINSQLKEVRDIPEEKRSREEA